MIPVGAADSHINLVDARTPLGRGNRADSKDSAIVPRPVFRTSVFDSWAAVWILLSVLVIF